jgi:hypothetical protein
MGSCCRKSVVEIETIEFTASSADGETWAIYYQPSDTKIGDLRKILDNTIQKIKADNMKLILDGKVLENDAETLLEAGFKQKCKVIVQVLRQ